MRRDLQLAFRRFRFRPAHTTLMIVILAVGIGATTAVFSVVDQTLLRPAPFAHADRLVNVLQWDRQSGGGGSSLTPGKIVGWQGQPALFEAFEGYWPRRFDLTGDGEPERLEGLVVTTGLFSMLGVQPRIGRSFAAGDGLPGGEGAVIISEGLWQRRLGGRPDVVGSPLTLNDERYTIVGVMPRRFRLSGDRESVWLPLDAAAHASDTSQRSFFGLARLAPGVARGSEQTLADTIADRLQQQSPLPQTWGLRLEPKRVAEVQATTRTALLALLGAVGFVLLITCANAANLFLSQIGIRQREMAIRTAIGAGRWRLVREVMAESLLLASCGGALGVLVAIWGIDAIVAAAPPNLTFQATTPIELDLRVLAVTAGLTVVCGVLFGALPALRGSRPQLDIVLKGTSTGGGGRAQSRIAGSLIVAEVAFSLILLTAAALMMRTFLNLEALDPGFEPDGLLAVEIGVPTDKYDAIARAAFFDSVVERVRGIPGVSHVAIAGGIPPSGGATHFGAPEAEGSTARAVGQEQEIPGDTVSKDFFRTARIPIVAGREFVAADTSDAVIVSKALADLYWPDGSAVGRRFRAYSRMPWQTIVGVAGNMDTWRTDERTALHLYSPWSAPTTAAAPVPASRRSYGRRVILVRAGDPAGAVPAIRAAVRSVDRLQPIDKISLVSDAYAATFGRQRFVLSLMVAFGAVAALLTMVGVFGVLSEVVSRRTREIGIRMALGARRSDVLRLVLGRTAALAVVGTLIGLAGAFALTRYIEALLFGVRPFDPMSVLAMTLLINVVAALACWIPARRATGVGPADALRLD